jgi:putative membrane protein
VSDTDLNRADLTNPPARRSATRVRLALVAVVLVPLAVAGLVVGATAGANDRLEDIPALVVNSDELVTQTAADGTKTQILAGRQLVTELTGKGTNGFDWQVSNAKDAAQKLKDGDVYAVLTVPKDFSK